MFQVGCNMVKISESVEDLLAWTRDRFIQDFVLTALIRYLLVDDEICSSRL